MAVAAPQPAWFVKRPSAETPNPGVIEDTMDYGERLFHYTIATGHDDVHFLEYRTLHRLNIFHLQNQLAELKGSYWVKGDVPHGTLGELKIKLHDYSRYLDLEMLNHKKFNLAQIAYNRTLYNKLALYAQESLKLKSSK